jgi:hypothetical protein
VGTGMQSQRLRRLTVTTLGAVLAVATFGCGSSGPASSRDADEDSSSTSEGGSAGTAAGDGSPDAADAMGGAAGAAGTSASDGGNPSDAAATDAPASLDASTDQTTDQTGVVGTPTSAMDLCAAYCHRVSTCDTSRDQQTCVAACTNANSAVFPKIRADLLTALAQCVGQKDCATITRDGALAACLVEAAAAVGPTTKATGFCAALDAAETTCGATIDKAGCLGQAKLYTDATLTDATACTAKACTLVYACASATLTPTTGSMALGGGLSPGKRCGGTPEPCEFLESSQSQCQAAGCKFSAVCEGGAEPCSAGNGSQSFCGEIAGCTWSGTTCSGTPTPCGQLTSQTMCQTSFDCFWEGSCTGTVPPCTTLSAATCSTEVGCMLQDAL